MKKFRTRSLHEAAALMAQESFEVEYIELEPTEQPNKFKFVLGIHTEEDTFNNWRRDYVNQKTRIEPKTYVEKLNILRDNLVYSKNS
jgi:hypothetical protein